MLLEGIFLPLTTPFHPDGRLFGRKLEANVARYSLTPAAGLLVGQVEADALTDAETACVLETAMRAAADEKVMIAVVGRESLARTLTLADCAVAAGYDAVAVRPPSLAGDERTRAEVLNYFRMVADHSELPVVVDCGGMRVDWVAELAGHANVIGALASNVPAVVERTREVSREVTVTSVFAAATGRMFAAGIGAAFSREPRQRNCDAGGELRR